MVLLYSFQSSGELCFSDVKSVGFYSFTHRTTPRSPLLILLRTPETPVYVTLPVSNELTKMKTMVKSISMDSESSTIQFQHLLSIHSSLIV
jgi:hypothetical protein